MARQYLGDHVERALRALGGDHMSKIIEKVGRKPCNCAGRKAQLNQWHKKVLEEIDKVKRSNVDG